MRIASVTLSQVSLPLVSRFRTSSHSKDRLTHIIVRVEAEDGEVGFGECACEVAPFYGPETVESCWHVLSTYLAPALLGLEWDEPEQATAAVAKYRGNQFAKAGLDMACWDLYARSKAMSLAQVLGGVREYIESGVSLGIGETAGDTIRNAERIRASGYRRAKLKVEPGMAEEVVRAVREVVPDLPLMVDANGAFTPRDEEELQRLDRYGLIMIEQPFDPADFLAHRDLARRISTPICLDESLLSLQHVRLALDLEAASIVNIKVSRLGGLGVARAVHGLCREREIPVWCGGMHE
jgi:O-succinylbenzoate synthase